MRFAWMRKEKHKWRKALDRAQSNWISICIRSIPDWMSAMAYCMSPICMQNVKKNTKKNAGCSTELIGNNTMTESSMEVNRKRTEKKNEWHCSRLDWMSTIDGGVWSTWPPTIINPLGIQRHCQFRSFLTRISQCHSRIHRVSFVVVIQIINPNPSQWINTTRQTFEFN